MIPHLGLWGKITSGWKSSICLHFVSFTLVHLFTAPRRLANHSGVSSRNPQRLTLLISPPCSRHEDKSSWEIWLPPTPLQCPVPHTRKKGTQRFGVIVMNHCHLGLEQQQSLPGQNTPPQHMSTTMCGSKSTARNRGSDLLKTSLLCAAVCTASLGHPQKQNGDTDHSDHVLTRTP